MCCMHGKVNRKEEKNVSSCLILAPGKPCCVMLVQAADRALRVSKHLFDHCSPEADCISASDTSAGVCG